MYALEGDRSTLGNAYWMIRAIDEVMDSLDENFYLLCSGLIEPLQARIVLHTAHMQHCVMHCAALQYAAH